MIESLASFSNSAPAITTQPQNQTNSPASTAAFTVTAAGDAPLAYRWLKNGASLADGGNVSGSGTATLTITNFGALDVAGYSVVVTNAYGAVTSVVATLSLALPAGFVAVNGTAAFTENFDSMGATGTNPPAGWFVGTGTGAISGTNVAISTGTSTTGTNYNFGTNGVNPLSDRALGSLASAGLQRDTELRLVNTSGSLITALAITYTGEQWRQGGSTATNNDLVMQYSVNGTAFTAMGAAFNFSTPFDSNSSAGALDGNRSTNRVTISGAIYTPAQPLTNGQVFYLRWMDTDDSGTDHALAIDDVSISFTLSNAAPVNAAPTDIALNGASVFENQPAGTLVGALAATDPDSGDTATFTLVTGTGDTDNASFAINGTNLVTAAVFDYETKTNYSIRVRVTDSGGLFFEKPFTIAVGDVNEAPSFVLTGMTVVDSTSQTNVPSGLGNVTAIAAGEAHSLALKNDGTVVAWGWNGAGQANVPAGLSSVTAIAAGSLHSLALKSNGTVVAWGYSDTGQTNVPAGLNGVTSIAGGGHHSLALKSDGTVVAWGDDSQGQVTVPIGLSGVTAISAGDTHSLALKNDGTVVGWGNSTNVPVPVGLTGVTAIAAGGFHSLALKNDGTVVAWGRDFEGQATVPAGLSGVTAIDAGNFHSLALKNDGVVAAWGFNIYRQTSAVAGLSNASAIAAGGYHSLALLALTITVAEDSGSFTRANFATNISAGPSSESSQTLNFIVTNNNPALFANQPAINTNGTLTFAPATNANGIATVTVQLLDSGGTANGGVDSATQTFRLRVNAVNDAPTDISLSGASVTENAASGTLVGTFTTLDVDAGDTATFTLVSGTGSDDNASFTISNGTNLVTAAVFDFETKTNYSIRVRATDSGGLFFEKQFTIAVGDVPDAPPSILAPPTNQTVFVGANVTNGVVAIGTPRLAYQWRFNGTNLADATNDALVLSAVQFTNAGNYDVVVANAFGSVTSSVAVLTVEVDYTLTNRVTLLATFTNPNPIINSRFGASVATIGNSGFIIANAPYGNGSTATSLAYLMNTNGTVMTTFTNPTPSNPVYWNNSVAAVDNETVLIGSAYSDRRVFFFSTNGTLLTTFSSPSVTWDAFGWSFAGLGSDRVLVGAPSDSSVATNSGVVHLFSTNGSRLAILTNPMPATNTYFGYAVAALGKDYVLVGAPYHRFDDSNTGVVFLLTTNGTLITTFTNPLPMPSNYFGFSLAAVGDSQVLVGAPWSRTGGAGRDAAYLFSTNGSLITSFATNRSSGYGYSVAAIGTDRVIIGGPLAGSLGGDASLYDTSGAYLAYLTSPVRLYNIFPGDLGFGSAMASMSGNRVLIGMPPDNTGTNEAGVAYLYYVPTNYSPSTYITTNSDPLGRVNPGSTFSIPSSTIGTPRFFYQWNFNTNPIPDQTNSVLLITNVQPTNAGYYFVVVTNLYGAATSEVARITVRVPPSFTLSPVDTSSSIGGQASFTTVATGSTLLRYQWFFGSNSIPDATNSAFTLTNVARSNSGYYSVTVTNAAGSVTSSNALLVVGGAAQRLLPLTALGGGRYRISFSDSTGGPLFDWDLSSLEVQGSTNMSGANWVTLTNALVITNGVGQVEFVVTNNPPQQFYRIRMR